MTRARPSGTERGARRGAGGGGRRAKAAVGTGAPGRPAPEGRSPAAVSEVKGGSTSVEHRPLSSGGGVAGLTSNQTARAASGAEALGPPGALSPALERGGAFEALARALPPGAVVFADAKVLRLHPRVAAALVGHRVLRVRAGEALKSLGALEALAASLAGVPRSATFVALGGGTVGDAITVLAHLHKRGVRLLHVPTTMLAAVDSSIGGKGAVNVGGVKNALGVFHGAAETWLCPAFFDTLSEAQRREGRLEAWKMVVTLDEPTFRRWVRVPPSDAVLLRTARALKAAVVDADPYEARGVRVVLNFGHTFGHVLESVSGYRVRHGEAVGLGLLCALDVGVALGVTPAAVARQVEAALPNGPTARRRLAALTRRASVSRVRALLGADKKGGEGGLRMVLLQQPGRWCVMDVPEATWAPRWARGWRRD
ncbi:MAG: 3-dehydroquinate synthase [Myxococcaceae bacterium]|jgi:3-dehydroquinate synthase|nr:3-dehydroquinate synthase [Myxococcaceae bacterium]